MICMMTTDDGKMTQKHKPARVPFGYLQHVDWKSIQVSFPVNRHVFLPQPLYFTPDAAQPYTLLSVPVISIIHGRAYFNASRIRRKDMKGVHHHRVCAYRYGQQVEVCVSIACFLGGGVGQG